jgi:hypothetical protein
MRSKSRAKRSNTELNPLIGDFINTIDPERTKRGLKPAVQRSAARTCDVLSFASEAENRGLQHPTSIQNNSGLPQGPAGPSAAG